MVPSSFCLRCSYNLYISSDSLVSLVEVFLAGQPNNDASVLTALNNTKTHFSKQSSCFSLTVFAALLQFCSFSCLAERGVHFKERRVQFCVGDQPPILSLCQNRNTAVIRHPDPSNLQSLPPGYSLSCLLNSTQLHLILVTQTHF